MIIDSGLLTARDFLKRWRVMLWLAVLIFATDVFVIWLAKRWSGSVDDPSLLLWGALVIPPGTVTIAITLTSNLLRDTWTLVEYIDGLEHEKQRKVRLIEIYKMDEGNYAHGNVEQTGQELLMTDGDAKRKKQGSELSQTRDLLNRWRRIPVLIVFMLITGFFMVWALLRLTDSKDIAAYLIVLAVTGGCVGSGIALIMRLLKNTRALIQRIDDMEQEQARIQMLTDADTRRLEMPESVTNETVFSDNHAEKQETR